MPAQSLHRRTLLAWLGSACAAMGASSLGGCAGYQIGNRSLYRCDIRTVHVPIFRSDSLRRYLGERLTEAVVKRIESETPMKVVDSDAADSVLSGRIISERKRVLSETRFDDPRDIEVDFFVQVTWVDRRGDLITGPHNMPIEPQLMSISQSANFLPEGGMSIATAHQVAISRLAEQIVGQMESAW
jgi:hypothetical protein